MKKLLKLTLITSAIICTLFALSSTVSAETSSENITISNVKVYENAFGVTDKSMVEFRLSNGNGQKTVTANGEEIFYNVQKEAYIGLVPASSISDASMTVQVTEKVPTPFVYGNTDDEIDTEEYNNSIDAYDLQLMKLHLAGKKALKSIHLISSDLDGDGEFTAADMQQIKLNIKNKREFDVLNTLNTETYVANTITTDSRTGFIKIVDLYRNTSISQRNILTIDLKDVSKEINIYDKSGNIIDKSSISRYSTLHVNEYKTSSTTSVMNIWVCNDQINGTVDSVTDNTVVIDGTTYEVSDYYKKYAIGNDSSNIIKENISAIFYLDMHGKISAKILDAKAYRYAYVYNIEKPTDADDDSFIIEYIDQSGEPTKYLIDYKIEYDGTRLSPTEGMQHLMHAAANTNYDKTTAEKGTVYSQLIKYSINGVGNFSTIATVGNLADEYTIDILSNADLDYTQKEDGSYEPLTYKYITSTSGSFGSVPKIDVNSSTTVFVVDRGRAPTHISKSTVAKEFNDEENYIVELFDVKNGIAKACVVYKHLKPALVTLPPNLYVINHIISTHTKNNAGEIGEKAEINTVNTRFSSDTVTSADEGTFTGWGEGCVVIINKNEYGDIYSEADGSTVVWDVTSPNMPEDNKWVNERRPSAWNGIYYQTVVGVIESFDPKTGILVFIPSTDFASINDESDRVTYRIYPSTESSCGYLIYHSWDDADPVWNITYEELEGNIITYEDDPENATEVLMHITGTQSNLSPKLVYIINR